MAKSQKKQVKKIAKAGKKVAAKVAKKTAKKPMKAAPKKTKMAAKKPVKKARKLEKAAKPAKAVKAIAKKSEKKGVKPQKINLNLLISPLDDRVLVQIQAGERVTAGGLIIPDTAQVSGNQRGVVVAVGRGHRDNKGRIRPLELKIGDLILVSENSGDSIEVVGEDLKILRESEILGVLDL